MAGVKMMVGQVLFKPMLMEMGATMAGRIWMMTMMESVMPPIVVHIHLVGTALQRWTTIRMAVEMSMKTMMTTMMEFLTLQILVLRVLPNGPVDLLQIGMGMAVEMQMRMMMTMLMV